MGNLLFSPSGRIGPSEYMKGIIIITVVSLILNFLPLISPALAMLGIIGFVLFYCFIALGIKRSHDAGKSGWMVLIHILIAIIVMVVTGFITGMVTGVSAGDAFSLAMSGDTAAVEELTAKTMSFGYLLPANLIGAAGTLLIGFLVNMLNKSDPDDNQYGPATLGDS